ncbi:MAG: hypothetical protein AAFW66_05360 [Pseudomonadota bacterium]
MTEDELASLSTRELVDRMDHILLTITLQKQNNEDTWQKIKQGQIPLVNHFVETETARDMTDTERRRLIDCAFRFLHNEKMIDESIGCHNYMMIRSRHTGVSENSPAFLVQSSVFEQYVIIASRIHLEIFFDLIHVAESCTRIRASSKFKYLKKWIKKPGNNYSVFLPMIARAFQYDRVHRQREVHGTSKFVNRSLCGRPYDIHEVNIGLHLLSLMSGVISPIINLLNGTRPRAFSSGGGDPFEKPLDESRFWELYSATPTDELLLQEEIDRIIASHMN